MVFACVPTVLVDFADADLDGGMIFRFYDAVRGAALAGDVTVHSNVSSTEIWMPANRTSIGRHVQVDEFATFILHLDLMAENKRCKDDWIYSDTETVVGGCGAS